MPSAAMVFTAGKGTRMAPLTNTTPKPMIPVNGRPLLDYALDFTREENLRTVVNLHHLPDQITDHLKGSEVLFSDECTNLLETGGGLKNASKLLNSNPVFTLNSDAIWLGPNPLSLLRAAWDASKMDALLVLIPLAQAEGHKGVGDFSLSSDGTIARAGSMLYTGAQIIKTDGLAAVSDACFSLNLLWDILLQEKRVFGLTYPGKWCDVGRPENIQTAEKLLQKAADV